MHLKAVAVLVARRQRDDHRFTTSHTGFANGGKRVKRIEFLRIKHMGGTARGVTKTRYQAAADTLSVPIDTYDFLS